MPGLPAAIMFGNLNMVPFVGFFLPTNGSFGRTEDDALLVDGEEQLKASESSWTYVRHYYK
jgi:hypothetical protein